MLRQITRQISTKIDSRLWSSLLEVFFTLAKCNEPTCSTDCRVYKLIAALRSAMMISLQVLDEWRFCYRVGVGVSLSVLITIPESN